MPLLNAIGAGVKSFARNKRVRSTLFGSPGKVAQYTKQLANIKAARAGEGKLKSFGRGTLNFLVPTKTNRLLMQQRYAQGGLLGREGIARSPWNLKSATKLERVAMLTTPAFMGHAAYKAKKEGRTPLKAAIKVGASDALLMATLPLGILTQSFGIDPAVRATGKLFRRGYRGQVISKILQGDVKGLVGNKEDSIMKRSRYARQVLENRNLNLTKTSSLLDGKAAREVNAYPKIKLNIKNKMSDRQNLLYNTLTNKKLRDHEAKNSNPYV